MQFSLRTRKGRLDNMSENELPIDVASVLKELKADPAVLAVWLIGSRANCRARPNSDWDLLVFASTEPVPKPAARNPFVDVLWKGPSGAILVEGMSDVHTLPFDGLQWSPDGPVAMYQSRKYIDCPPGASVDIDAPRYAYECMRAMRLWAR